MGSRIGSRKEFKQKGKTGIQYCIDAYLLTDVLSFLPKDVKIYGANVRVYSFGKTRKIPVPNKLRKLGVGYIHERSQWIDMSVVFDETTKTTIEKNIKAICKITGFEYRKAEVKSITLANNEASVYFHKTTKEQYPDETDLRRKLKVLGAKTGEGKVHSLYSQLGAEAIECQVEEVIVRTAICKKRGKK
jgi:hypothetical protein